MPLTTVLLVEDHPGVAAAVASGLGHAGFEVHHVGTIAAAQEAVRRRTYDLLLLDLSLPNGDGMMVIDRVAPLAPGVPFLVLTGHTDDTLAISAITRGADDVLYKATHGLADELARRLRFALYRCQRQRANGQALDVEAEQRMYQRRSADRRDRNLDRVGWAMVAMAAVVLVANVVADLAARQRPSFSITTAVIIFFLSGLGGTITQRGKVSSFVDSFARLRGPGPGGRRTDTPEAPHDH